MDERYPTMKLEMGSGISRTSVYTLEIKLDSWDKKTKEKFMNGDVFRDSEIRYHARRVLEKHGLKEAHINSGWGCEIQNLESTRPYEEIAKEAGLRDSEKCPCSASTEAER